MLTRRQLPPVIAGPDPAIQNRERACGTVDPPMTE